MSRRINRAQARNIRFGLALGRLWVERGYSRSDARWYAEKMLGGKRRLVARAFLRATGFGRCRP